MFHEAVVGVNFGPGGDAASALARCLVARDGRITLVNVVASDPTVFRGNRDSVLVGERARSLSLLDRERALVLLDRGVEPGPRIDTCALAAASPARGLEAVAARRRADLVVVGASRRSGLGRVLLGDDASAALRRAACAVAVAPSGYAGSGALDRVRIAGDERIADLAALSGELDLLVVRPRPGRWAPRPRAWHRPVARDPVRRLARMTLCPLLVMPDAPPAGESRAASGAPSPAIRPPLPATSPGEAPVAGGSDCG